jgi:hypothetical protein
MWKRFASTGLVVVAATFTACSDSGKTDPPPVDPGADAGISAFECKEGRDGWQQCEDGKIQYCHIVSGMDPHFHWGTDCQALGLSCVNLDAEGNAACVDRSKSCVPADEKCDANTAYFCVEGKLGQEPCGTAAECHAGDGEKPHCEDKGTECGGHGHVHDAECHCDTGYSLDPTNKLNCIADVDVATAACAAFGQTPTPEAVVDVFADFPKAHVDVEKLYELTLPDGKPSYVHFPVTATQKYVISLSEPGVFDAFVHRSGQDVSPAPVGGAPNAECATVIKDQWHATLAFDGSATDAKVPYIVRLKPQAGGKKVVVMLKADSNPGEAADDPDAERLTFVDAVESKASVFDVTEKRVVGSFTLGGAATVGAGPSGRFAYLVEGTANQVQIIDTGLVFEDHGDHQHYDRTVPSLLTYSLPGVKPVHFVGHDDFATLFFDGAGVANVLDERTLLTAAPTVVTIETGVPHHGVALTFGGAVLATHAVLAAGDTTAKAQGIQVFSMAGVKEGDPILGCPGLHGEAANATHAVFGCTDGALLMTKGASGFTSLKVANPPADPDAGTPPRISTTIGHPAVAHFVGNFGATALAKIDPSGAGSITRIDLPAALATAGYSQFAFDKDGGRLLVLGKDGNLYALDATTGVQIGTASAVATFATGLTPKLAIGRRAVYVSDPKEGAIRKVEAATLAVAESFVVGGAPGNLAVQSFVAAK